MCSLPFLISFSYTGMKSVPFGESRLIDHLRYTKKRGCHVIPAGHPRDDRIKNGGLKDGACPARLTI
jgi:hypothetical protein